MTSVPITSLGAGLPVYSPSQIETWLGCPRKWGLEKIDRLPKAQHASAAFGESIHGQLEDHLKGKGLDFARDHRAAELAQLAIPHLPAPNAPGLVVEGAFKQALSNRPHTWTGRIDWALIQIDLTRGGPRFTVGDHKSTSSISSWAKTIDQLRTDTQATVYSKWGLTAYPELECVDLQWTYLQTKGPKIVEPRRLTLYRPEVEERFEALDKVAELITFARSQVKSGMELPYNPDHCDAYGGCPYQHKCNLSPFERIRSMSAPTTSDLMARLQQMQAQAQGAPQPAAATVPQPAPFQPPPASAVPAAPGAFQPPPAFTAPATPAALPTGAVRTGLSSFVGRDAQGRVTTDLQGRRLRETTIQTQYVPVPGTNGYMPIEPNGAPITDVVAHALVADADAAAREAAAPPTQGWAPAGQTPPPAAPVQQPPAQTGPINPPEWQPAPTAAQVVGAQVAEASAPAAPETTPKKRGRPAKNAAAPATPATVSNDGRTQVENIDPLDGLLLFVRCRPVKGFGPIMDLADIVARVQPKVKEQAQVDDFSFIDYGKGQGLLALLVEAEVKSLVDAHGSIALHVDPGTREASVCLSKLVVLATSVVRG